MLAIIGRRWSIFLLVALPLALGGVILVSLLPSRYDAETTVAFAPRDAGEVGADVIRVVLPRYVALLSAPATTQRVATEVNIPPEVLETADVAIALDTANLTITVRDTDPDRAAAAANALAAVAVEAAERDDDLLVPQLLAAALPPTSPAAPRRGLLAAAALLAGLMAGLAAAVLAERLRPRLRSVGDIGALSSVPVLANIPTSRALLSGRTTPTDDDLVGSSVRAALARAERRADAPDARIVGVTAPSYGHGKTSLAMACAAAAARRGRRVVLVDGDNARSKLTSLTVEPGTGSEAESFSQPARHQSTLLGGARLEQSLSPGPVPGVMILPAGVIPQTPDALAMELGPLLKEVLTRADQVIVDCPPLSDEDGQTLVAQLPTALLVLRRGSPAGDLTDSTAQLKGMGVHVLGILLNRTGRRQERRPTGWWNDVEQE